MTGMPKRRSEFAKAIAASLPFCAHYFKEQLLIRACPKSDDFRAVFNGLND
jgi:hypothetical protein